MAPAHGRAAGAHARLLPAVKLALLIAVLGALLAAAVIFTFTHWDASAMSVHGWIALGAGAVLSFVIGAGLMALMFYSARHGYDDRIDVDLDDDHP